MHSVGFELSEFQVCVNSVAKLQEFFFINFNYNSSLWEYMAQCISQHNFMPDLDIDLKLDHSILYSLGSILSFSHNSIKSLILPANQCLLLSQDKFKENNFQIQA